MKLIKKLVGSLSLTIWLSMLLIVSVEAQIDDTAVNDVNGLAVQAGVGYYVLPGRDAVGGPVNAILINDTCPYYVSQLRSLMLNPVVFTPLEEGETVIRQDRDVKIEFKLVVSNCNQSSYAWLVDDKEPIPGTTLIATGKDTSPYPTRNYFRIEGTNETNEYSFRWCKLCLLECYDVGPADIHLGEETPLVLGGTPVLSVVFQKVQMDDTAVNDVNGEAVQAGVGYYVLPGRDAVGGPVNAILINDTCPYYVSQLRSINLNPVVFTPLEEGETVIRQDRDVKIEFKLVVSHCNQSSYAWLVDDKEPIPGTTLIATGKDTSPYPTRNYFRIEGTNETNEYSFRWCKLCLLECYDVGPADIHLGEETPLVLGGTPVLSVVFQKVPPAPLSSLI